MVRPERDDCAERQVARHGGVVERVADERRLEERAEVSVPVPAESIAALSHELCNYVVRATHFNFRPYLLYKTVR